MEHGLLKRVKSTSRSFADGLQAPGFLRRLGWVARNPAHRRAEPSSIEEVLSDERTLSRLLPGERGVVGRVAGSGPIRQRLLELGVTPGAKMEVIRFAPLGDPMEVRVRGYHLSLRRREAEAIWLLWEERERDGIDTPNAASCGPGGQSQ